MAGAARLSETGRGAPAYCRLVRTLTRRGALLAGLTVTLDPGLAHAALRVAVAGHALEATPACDEDETPEQTEGPFYTPRTPRRTSLVEPGMPGKRLVLSGRVLTTRCRPVRGAVLDFWQADARGRYDNRGFRLRGHQLADAFGRYRLETVVPGLYTGRTRHIHVKTAAPRRPVLTTQLYFPGEPANAADGIFDARLLVRAMSKRPALWTARFDFVVEA